MKLLALAMLATLSGFASPPSTHAAPPEPIAIVPAMSALEVQGVFVAWAPDLRAVLGLDARGARLWRVATGDQGGVRDLDVLGDNLVVYAGTEVLLIAPTSGAILGRRGDVVLGVPGGPEGCRLREEEGACALACECRFELVSCTDLKPIGPPAMLPRVELADPFEAVGVRTSSCASFSRGVLGKAGELVVSALPVAGEKAVFSVSEAVVARHAKTGAEAWRRAGHGPFDPTLSGVHGDVCYTSSRGGPLTVFDCQRGEVLWTRKLALPKGAEPQVDRVGEGLMVRDGARVLALELRSGRVRWEAAVPADRIALALGVAPRPVASFQARPVDRRLAKPLRGALVLDPETGAKKAELDFPEGVTRWPRTLGTGWLVLGRSALAAFAANGSALGSLPVSDVRELLVSGADVVFAEGRATSKASKGTKRKAGVIRLWSPPQASAEVLDEADQLVAVSRGPDGALVVATVLSGRGAWDPKEPTTFGELRLFRR